MRQTEIGLTAAVSGMSQRKGAHTHVYICNIISETIPGEMAGCPQIGNVGFFSRGEDLVRD